MAEQTNRIAVFVFIVVATILLCEVYIVSSLPRGYYGYLPRRVLTRDGSHWKLKRMFTSTEIHDQSCNDQRDDCSKIIKPDLASYWCNKYKGQCDFTCGTCNEGLICKDVLDGHECTRALLFAMCRDRKFKDGCLKTCCECDESSLNCN